MLAERIGMAINILKKNNEPVVEQSLEATRNIEYQLLNMKNELEKFSSTHNSDVDIAPAVSQTFETLHQIEAQLQNMRSLLENYSNLIRFKENENNQQQDLYSNPGKPPNPQPFSPTKPPTYPPPYERPRTPPYSTYHENEYEDSYYYHDYHYPRPCYGGPVYGRPYGSPPQQLYYYPPHPNYGYPDENIPIQDYPPLFSQEEIRTYHGAKYPTASSSEPAYSTNFRAVPSHTFRIAYYPWQQLTGKRSPTSSRTPYMNIYDLGAEYLIYVELPGVEKENLELRVDDQSIWINGKPTIGGCEDGTPVVQEHGYHEFYRQVQLPSKIISNKTTCLFDNGILKIKLIKTNPKKTPHKVKIQ